MAFENFPYTNFHEINLDWILKRVKNVYSEDNPPDYPVKSVNGMTGDVIIAIPANMVQSVNGETGDVILYRNPLTQFPSTDGQRWNLFRICDGSERGIEFDEDGAHRIEGTRRILIYDSENQPDYPVTSVNGQTGDVRISAGVNSVNGKTGNVVTPFVNPNADILTLDSKSNTVLWGISRDVAGGNTALYISTGAGSPQAFIRYTPASGEPINLPLLSSADIPSEAGVISVNGATGVVTLYGTNINTSDTSAMTIFTKLSNITTLAESLTNILMTESNEVTWSRGGLNASNGNAYVSNNFIRTGILPANIALIAQKWVEMSFRLYAYESGEYKGIYHSDTNTFAPESSNAPYAIFTSINLAAIKSAYPTYTFRLVANAYPTREVTTDDSVYIGIYYPKENDISQLQADVAALQATDAEHTQRINELWAGDGIHNQQIAELQATDATHNQQIVELQAADANHSQLISELWAGDGVHNQQIAALQASDATQNQQISELYTRTGVYVVSIANANTMPLRFPASGSDSKIKATNKVVSMDLSVPGVQVSPWTITTYDGYLEITGTMNGTSDITLYLA